MQERPGTRVPVAKVVDLTAALDPAAQAAQALALNLKLMRWRAAPALDLPAIAATHCLLLGAVPRHLTPLSHARLRSARGPLSGPRTARPGCR